MWHTKKAGEVIRELGTSVENGLSLDEVKIRTGKFGKNVLKEHKGKCLFGF